MRFDDVLRIFTHDVMIRARVFVTKRTTTTKPLYTCVLFTARSVFLFVFFVFFLNERQKANEDACTGPFPYKEGVEEKRTKLNMLLPFLIP